MSRRPKNLVTPLEAIPPIIKKALTEALTKDITLTFDSPRIAASFVAECNSYRKQLHNSSNPEHKALAVSLYKVKATRPGSGSEVRLYPRGQEFASAYEQLDMETPVQSELHVNMKRKEPPATEIEHETTHVNLDDFLHDIEED